MRTSIVCVAITIAAFQGFAQELALDFTPTNPLYNAGGENELTLDMTVLTPAAITAAGIELTLPEGWTFQAVTAGDTPSVQPTPGLGGLLEFAWFNTPYPQPPYSFSFSVTIPENLEDDAVSLTAIGRYRSTDFTGEHQTNSATATFYAPVPHTWFLDAAATEPGDGSEDLPFQTLEEAMNQCVPGRNDVVYTSAGTYVSSGIPASTALIGTQGAHFTRIEPGPREKQIEQTVELGDGAAVRGFTFATGDPALRLAETAAAELRNCIVTGAILGVDASLSGALPTCINVTFHANGTAIRLREGVLQNCVFSENDIAVDLLDSGEYTGGYNLFHDNETAVNGGTPDTTSVFDDAGHVAPDSGNLHLRADSPARDAGDPDPAHSDPNGSRNDIGVDGGPYAVSDTEAPVPVIARTPAEGAIEMWTSLHLDAGGSTDEWGIAAYTWDFDYDGTFTEDAAGVEQDRLFTTPGDWRVAVRVTDNSGLSAIAEITVTVTAADVLISGYVRDADQAALAGVSLAASGVEAETESGADGAYTLTVPKGFTGTVTPSFGSYAFTPETRAYTQLLEDDDEEDYTGECAAPDAPGNMTASDGNHADKVEISWETVPGAEGYRVYRAGSADFSDAVALGDDWAGALTFEDATAQAAEVERWMGCSWFEEVTLHKYYYRVVARNACGESAPSVGDEGYRGEPAKALGADMAVAAMAVLLLLTARRRAG